MSDCEFCHEDHCIAEDLLCSCRGPGGICQATPDDLIEACCPDPACCYAGWDGQHCDCGEQCDGCRVGAIMRHAPSKIPGTQEDFRNAICDAVVKSLGAAGTRVTTLEEQMGVLCDPARHVRR